MKIKKSTPNDPFYNYSGTLKGYFLSKMRRIYRRDKFELLKPLIKLITSRWVIKGKFIDFKSYTRLKPHKVHLLFEENISLHYSSAIFYNKTNNEALHEVKNHYRYCAKLNNVTIIGSSDIIILDEKYVLYDLKFWDKENVFDYTDNAIQFYKNDFCIIEIKKSLFNIDEAILLSGNYSFNYYHFLFEIIGKFEVLSKLNLDKSIPIIIDSNCLKVPQYVELLSYFNTDNRNIIPVDKEILYQVSTLYHVSCPNIIPPNFKNITDIKSKHNLFYLDSLNFTRNKLLKLTEKENSSNSKRIFISRKNASGRRIYNEEQVYELLKKFNFSIIYPEDYTLLEQVSLFKNAKLIVGATGAAFTNLLFCANTCKVICLTNFNINVSIFSTIAKHIGFKLIYIHDERLVLEEFSDLHSAFDIDLQKLEMALLEIM